MATEVGTAYVTIIPSARGFAAKMQGEVASELRQALGVVPQEGERAGRSFADRFRGAVGSGLSALGGIVKAGATAAAVGVTAGLGALTAFGLKSAASLEQTQISFNSLLGSAEEGQRVFGELQKFAAQTPFEFPEVAGAAKRILAMGQAAGISKDQLQGVLTTIGNVASVTGGGSQALDSVTLAMGQIASTGKVTLDNLNQISEALPGFSGPAAIAAATGKSTAEVMKEISAGTLDAQTGIAALIKGMQQFPGAAGAMEAQSQTLLGVFSTFKDTVGQALAGAFAPVIPEIKSQLGSLTPVIGTALGQLAPALGGALAAVLPLVSSLLQGLVPILTPIITALGTGLASLAPAVVPLGQALGDVAGAIAPLLPLLGQIIAAVAGALAPAISSLMPLAVGLANGLTAALVPLLPVIIQIGQTLGQVLAPVAEALGQAFAQLGPIVGQLVGALGTALAPLLVALGPVVKTLLDALQPLFPALAPLAQPIGDLVVALTPLIELAAQLLVLVVDLIAPLIKLVAQFAAFTTLNGTVPLIKAIADALTTVLQPVSRAAELLGNLGKAFTDIDWGNVGSTIVNAVTTAFNAVVSFFVSLPQRIGEALAALPGILVQSAVNAFDLFFQAIGFGIGTIVHLWATLPGQVWSIVTNLWATAANLTNAGISAVVGFVSSLPGRIAGFVSQAWSTARALFAAGVDAVVSFASSLPGRTASAVSGLPGAIAGAIRGAIGTMREIGGNIIDAVADGIRGAIGRAVDAAKRAMGDIVAGAKKALGISSPSRVFLAIGSDTIAGYVKGVDGAAGDAADAIRNALMPPSLVDLKGAMVAADASAVVPAPAAVNRTINVYPQRADFTVDDLRALQTRDDIDSRAGRPV